MRKALCVLAVLVISAAGLPLLARLDSLVSCPGLSNDTLTATAFSTALVAVGAVLLVMLWRTRSGSAPTPRDEYVLIAVIALIVSALTAFWPIASAADDWASVLRGVDAGRCIPLSISGPVLWILAIAPVGAPVLDGFAGVLVWHRTRAQWFPAFSMATAVFFAAVLLGFTLIGSQLPNS
ncbi:hypothetical protein CLV49_2301 [Labedella gwakjiensis]|uniref:Uncharacterized protein n=1 Tax=Labedella gwakjiensis TaxID=390269 RepID=A0A2P8GXI9_9MICO|nr:hypothetical protein [Labedella gwakjiensis]PSL38673.1 hypothetical protein CLV49_2301 [Labedella gwakjiensis]RUQ86830.1 hypothetical protein ELQ93_07725 [Labedella gwakjiensis]